VEDNHGDELTKATKIQFFGVLVQDTDVTPISFFKSFHKMKALKKVG